MLTLLIVKKNIGLKVGRGGQLTPLTLLATGQNVRHIILLGRQNVLYVLLFDITYLGNIYVTFT
jgi:hypothetical protein